MWHSMVYKTEPKTLRYQLRFRSIIGNKKIVQFLGGSAVKPVYWILNFTWWNSSTRRNSSYCCCSHYAGTDVLQNESYSNNSCDKDEDVGPNKFELISKLSLFSLFNSSFKYTYH